jgi:O-antigen/teichoic acid export membrane protein
MGAMFFGVLFTIINTRLLTKSEFGTLNFYIQVLMFLALIFEFGYFAAGSRLIALERDYKKERELIGALYIFGLIISTAYIIVLFILSFFVDDIFKSNVRFLILIGLIPSVAFPFQFLIQLIFQGSNEVLKLSVYTLLPRLLYFVFIAIAYLINLFNLKSTSFLYVFSYFVATLFTIIISKPSLKNFNVHLKEIIRETKEYGFKVYIGRVTGMIGYQSNVLIIQYFAKELEVANYSLINFFTTPISVFSRSLCTSLFKGFANQNEIPGRVFKVNYIWLTLVSIIYILIGEFILELLFSKKYLEATPLILPLVIANFFMGASQPYNFFLSAKGKGDYLQKIALSFSFYTIILNLLLIPFFKAMGAAIATLISVILNFISYRFYYKKSIKE